MAAFTLSIAWTLWDVKSAYAPNPQEPLWFCPNVYSVPLGQWPLWKRFVSSPLQPLTDCPCLSQNSRNISCWELAQSDRTGERSVGGDRAVVT